MVVSGYLRNETKMRILIDSGANKNFIDLEFVNKNKLLTTEYDTPVCVTLADG